MFINKPRVSRPYKTKHDMKSMHELNTYTYLISLYVSYYGDILTKNGNRNYEGISAEQNSRNKILFVKWLDWLLYIENFSLFHRSFSGIITKF